MELAHAAAQMLDPGIEPGELQVVVEGLFERLADEVGLVDEARCGEDLRETLSPRGLALSPRDAARCLRDGARTAGFLRGLETAIRDRVAATEGKVRVLYAGCGPFAPMFLILAARFEPADVEFVLIDLHRRSLEMAAALAERHGVADRVRAYVEGDAATYRCPPDGRPHVVFTETMQKALHKEPQVAIVANLAPQLLPGGSLVPEAVTLRACLFDPHTEFGLRRAGAECAEPPRPIRVALGEVFRLDRSTRLEALRPVRVTVPDPLPAGLDPIVETDIRIHGEIRLGGWDSGLTMPTVLTDLALRGGEAIEFRYELEPLPRLVYRAVSG